MAKIKSTWQIIKSVFHQIQTEDGVYSANRVAPIWILLLFTLLFIGITCYVFFNDSSKTQYNDLGMIYLGVLVSCGAWLQGHHLTNSIYNTPLGSNGKPNSLVTTVTSMTNKLQEQIGKDTK